jgi:hypothetical protein
MCVESSLLHNMELGQVSPQLPVTRDTAAAIRTSAAARTTPAAQDKVTDHNRTPFTFVYTAATARTTATGRTSAAMQDKVTAHRSHSRRQPSGQQSPSRTCNSMPVTFMDIAAIARTAESTSTRVCIPCRHMHENHRRF